MAEIRDLKRERNDLEAECNRLAGMILDREGVMADAVRLIEHDHGECEDCRAAVAAKMLRANLESTGIVP